MVLGILLKSDSKEWTMRCERCRTGKGLYEVVMYLQRKRGRPRSCEECRESIGPYVIHSFESEEQMYAYPYL